MARKWSRSVGGNMKGPITIGYLGTRHDSSPAGSALLQMLQAHANSSLQAHAVLLSPVPAEAGDETSKALRRLAKLHVGMYEQDAHARASSINRAGIHVLVVHDVEHPGTRALLALAPAPMQIALLHANQDPPGPFPGFPPTWPLPSP